MTIAGRYYHRACPIASKPTDRGPAQAHRPRSVGLPNKRLLRAKKPSMALRWRLWCPVQSLPEAPCPGALLDVIQDVVIRIDLMLSIGDGLDATSLGPETAPVSELVQQVIRVLLGPAHPGARGLFSEAPQQVQVNRIQGKTQELDFLKEKHLDHSLAGLFSHRLGELDRRAFQQSPGPLAQRPVPFARRRMLVIPFDVPAVMTGSPPSRISAQPCPVGAARDVIPPVPPTHGVMLPPNALRRKDQSPGANKWC